MSRATSPVPCGSQALRDAPPVRRGDEPGRVRAVAAYDVLGTGPEPEFDDLAALAAQLLGTPHAVVSVADDRRVWFKATVLDVPRETPVELSFCARVVERGAPVVIPDASRDPQWADHPLVRPPGGLRFFTGVPLVTAEGYAVGAVSVWSDTAATPTADQIAGLQRLARQAVALLELRRRTAELERDRTLLALSGEVLSAAVSGADLSVLLSLVTRGVERSLPGVRCAVSLLDGDRLTATVAPSLPADYVEGIEGLRVGSGVDASGGAAATDLPAVSTDIATDPRWAGLRFLALSLGLRSCWSVPLCGAGGRVLGTMSFYHATPQEPGLEDWELVLQWVALAALAVERSRAQEELRRLAGHDALTDLPNRARFLDVATEALRSRGGAVLFVDLDRFKLLNDSRGHHVGDAYLRAVADRLRAAVRGGDVVGRFGGDEFVVLCPGLDDPVVAERVALRVVEAARQPVRVPGGEVALSASVGVAMAGPGEVDPELLLRDADAAMYRAKQRGRDRIEVFDAAQRGPTLDRLDLETELRAAIARGELRCAYQPEVDLTTGTVVGVEALARWTSPTRGPVSPVDFIAVAEDSDLVCRLGELVLRSATARLAAWRAEDPSFEAVSVWVNVSARQLSSPGLVEAVTDALAASGLPGDRLGLEVTESTVASDLALAREVLERLRGLGVRVAVDDFGTGFSSLAQLKRFPVDVVKIDRSLVDGLGTDPDDTAIVEAITALARALRLSVVAEGVETARQRDELLRLGCDVAQGWFFSPPREGTDLPRLTPGGGPVS